MCLTQTKPAESFVGAAVLFVGAGTLAVLTPTRTHSLSAMASSPEWHASESAGTWAPDGYISPIESGRVTLKETFEEGRFGRVLLGECLMVVLRRGGGGDGGSPHHNPGVSTTAVSLFHESDHITTTDGPFERSHSKVVNANVCSLGSCTFSCFHFRNTPRPLVTVWSPPPVTQKPTAPTLEQSTPGPWYGC